MDGEFNLSNTIGIGLNIGEQMLLPVSNGEEEPANALQQEQQHHHHHELHHHHHLQHQQQPLQEHQTHFDTTAMNMEPAVTANQVSCLDNQIGNFYPESTDLEDLNAKLAETTQILQYTPVEKPTELVQPTLEENTVKQIPQEFETPAVPVVENKEPVEQVDKSTENEEANTEEKDAEDDEEDEAEADAEAEAEAEEVEAEAEEAEAEDMEADDEVEEEEDEDEEEEEIIPDEVIVPESTEDKGKAIDGNQDEKTGKEENDDKDEINDNSNENDDSQNPDNESEEPVSTRADRRKEEEVDENQCRVCCGKENLISIFKEIEEQTIADMLMSICPSVSIVIKDFLPQFICNSCYDNVIIAIKLKTQCETTEKELRKKLSRHKNKIRRPVGYVVIDAPLDSDPPTDEEPANDEEFKVSDITSVTPSEDSDISEFSDSKKKKTRGRKRRKSAVVTPTDGKRFKTKSKSDIQTSDEEDDDDGDPIKHKRKRSNNSSPENFACDECDQSFSRKQSLVLHKRQHVYDRGDPIKCEVCGKKFKIKGAYRTHLEKHKEERRNNKCAQCSRRFTSSSDLKRHIAEDHREKEILPSCSKCNRTFSSAGRLQRHKQGGCPAVDTSKNKKSETNAFTVGTDLFKAVAPLQTTYWSDSFSD